MALIDKARERPSVFLTDRSEMLPLTELIDNPFGFLQNRLIPNRSLTVPGWSILISPGSQSTASITVERKRLQSRRVYTSLLVDCHSTSHSKESGRQLRRLIPCFARRDQVSLKS